MRQLDRAEAQRPIGTVTVTLLASTFVGDVMFSTQRIVLAQRRGGRLSLRLVPNVCDTFPATPSCAGTHDEACFDTYPVPREVLPQLGTNGIDPVVDVCGVDLLAFRQIDPPALFRFVRPQRKLGSESPDPAREHSRGDVAVETRFREHVWQLHGTCSSGPGVSSCRCTTRCIAAHSTGGGPTGRRATATFASRTAATGLTADGSFASAASSTRTIGR